MILGRSLFHAGCRETRGCMRANMKIKQNRSALYTILTTPRSYTSSISPSGNRQLGNPSTPSSRTPQSPSPPSPAPPVTAASAELRQINLIPVHLYRSTSSSPKSSTNSTFPLSFPQHTTPHLPNNVRRQRRRLLRNHQSHDRRPSRRSHVKRPATSPESSYPGGRRRV